MLFFSDEKKIDSKKSQEVNNAVDDSYFKLTQNDKDYLGSLLLVLLNPTLALIGHGHFQYNSISLGLFQFALYFIIRLSFKNKISQIPNLVLASFFYCLALNYKQMELYHALPIFFFLLGICFKSNFFKSGFVIFEKFIYF